MLVVDASCLYEIVADTARADDVRARLAADPEYAAPSVVDVEVVSVIRRDHLLGRLDPTSAAQAVADLRDWPGHVRGTAFGSRFEMTTFPQVNGDVGTNGRSTDNAEVDGSIPSSPTEPRRSA